MTTVHAQADYAILPKGDPPPGYPSISHPDFFQSNPGSASYDQRRQDFMAHVLKNPAPQNTKPVWYELVRMAGGSQAHEGIIHSALDFIDFRKDCADFVQHGILRLLYQFDPSRLVDQPISINHYPSQDLLDRARQTTLNFKYFPDEPGIDSMCTWTENHYILFTSAAFLAGQLYPGEIFTNTGETGQEKMERNRPRILRWLDMRFRSGFSEWLSHVYYDEDLTALLSLFDFADDDEIRTKAAMILDLLLLDIALNSFKGVFGSTHGRAYENTKKWASNEGTTDTTRLLFGRGMYSGFDNMSAPAFVLSSYQMPAVIKAIANNDSRKSTNRQRMGHRVEDAGKWGLTYSELESGMIFYTNEAYLHPKTANLTLKMFDRFRWWQNDFFKDFLPYRRLLSVLRKLKMTSLLVRILERDVSRNIRDEANIYTYRTPDYMLSTAQDHRAGYGGDQHHLWQATLGPDAVCFTTHPAKIEGVTPNYWAGSGLLPRAAQYRNVTIAVYNLRKIPALYVPIRHFYTHAWVPKDQFNEIVEQSGWIFVRKGSAYLALHSMKPYFWNTQDARSDTVEFRHSSEDFDREVIAPGKKNIWICQLGRKEDDGPFASFIQGISNARLEFHRLSVQYQSPGNGLIQFGWKGPLIVENQEIQLKNYPRYDNPYCQAEFDPTEIKISDGEHTLQLDWIAVKRETT